MKKCLSAFTLGLIAISGVNGAQYTPLTNAHDSIRIDGKIIWESRKAKGMGGETVPGLYMADINDNGEIDTTSQKLLKEIFSDDASYREYNNAALFNDKIYNIRRGGDIVYIDVIDLKQGSEGVVTQTYKIPRDYGDEYRYFYGLQVIGASDQAKGIVLAYYGQSSDDMGFVSYKIKNDQLEKVDDLVFQNGRNYKKGDRTFFGQDYYRNMFKIRKIPGSNYIAGFVTYQGNDGFNSYYMGAVMVKVDNDLNLKKIDYNSGNRVVDYPSNIHTDIPPLQITDVIYSNYGVRPGFILATHYEVGGLETTKSTLYFMEVTSEDESGEKLTFEYPRSDKAQGDITDDILPSDKLRTEAPIKLIYPYVRDIDEDLYHVNLKVYFGNWRGGDVFSISNYALVDYKPDPNKLYFYDKQKFSLLEFMPYGVVFGAPPRYDDGESPELATKFTYGRTDSASNIYESTKSVSNALSLQKEVFGFGLGYKRDQKKSQADKDAKKITQVSSASYINKSYGDKSAWVLGSYVSPTDYVENYIPYDPLGNTPVAILNNATKSRMPYTPMNLKLDPDPKEIFDNSVAFDITKPTNIYGGTGSYIQKYAELTKGLPTFYAGTDIENYIVDNTVKSWELQAKKGKFTVYKQLLLTNVTQTKALSIENEHQYSVDNSLTDSLSLKYGSSGVTIESMWSQKYTTTFTKGSSWAFDYRSIDYNKVKKNLFSIYVYVFTPTEDANASDLPWSSDLMKEKNIKTWAVAYNVVPGLGAKSKNNLK
ncbi:hypothetical protein IB633_07145 [Francisella philomiragia]|uniref:Uncharacterized protein n=1 Tax=Francisella philomiragia subsp. philomiragia (strain ATCC 25017 / CCUG 19701 / FSC 153 / O\|nr:hypothetical protein [Francisella philomiragia]AJI48245.1 hypothetical protein BF30_1523 [Francisella philomiragia]AJI50058.1 hypothetical protein KU46_36 [Francisella philomiragia]MBK2020739.1 hypothetical protein [Francisella philomiragia]MBK2030841.1 hypothetical protein [Francisella philomiragia]MBK2263501.1 hypothetical protein [Francisella philomiragia]